MRTIIPGKDERHLADAVTRFQRARCAVALSGAGISVPSGIADFRSPGGVWTRYSPEEYATLSAFRTNPEKAWRLYRELGRGLVGKKPNPAHLALAALEGARLLVGIVTQNVDNLHQQAGSENVLEIHGDHQHLHCLVCGDTVAVTLEHYRQPDIPCCPHCEYPYKPNVVLFEEAVRHLDAINALIDGCDLLLVVGTSARIYPAAGLPAMVKDRGGSIFEFNLETALGVAPRPLTDFFFQGDLASSLPFFADRVMNH